MEIFGLTTGFVKRLRAVKDYRESHIIVHAEANDWTKADRYCRELMQPEYSPGVGKVWPNSQDSSGAGRYGVYTDEDEKSKWADCIEQAFLGEEVCYAQQFVSLDAEATQRKFEDQARLYRREIKEGKDTIFQDPRFRYTGKAPGRCDDLVSIFGLVERWAKYLRRDPRWQNWANEHGVAI
jgi:hypothetical protein